MAFIKDIGFKLQYLVKLRVSLNFTVHLYWDGKGQITIISLSITKAILLSFEMISIYIQHYLSFFDTDINTKCYKFFTSFACFPPHIFALFFSHFFFSFCTLACSALSIFILFNDYFLCNKEIIVCVYVNVLPMPVIFCVIIKSYIFKGGPYHKPYLPPWLATLPHLSDFHV